MAQIVWGLYLAEIVKEAGKDTWKNRAKIWSATVTAVHRVNQFATALGRLRSRLRSKTRIEVGLPVPNGNDGTRLELEGSDVDELALQLALFVHHLPTLLDLMRKEKFDRSSVASGIQLKLLSDASLQVSWQDHGAFQKGTRVLSFTPDEPKSRT